MRVLGKKSTLVVAAATVAMWAVVGSASAQVNGSNGGSAAKSSNGAGVPVDMGSPPTAASVYAHKKADDAMARLRDAPQNYDANHRKAAAAMSR